MFELEEYNAETHKDYGKADYLRLEVGQRIRNITLTGITEGENQYGYFCLGFFKTESGAKGFVNLSSKLIEAFTDLTSSGRVLKSELRDKKIWIGKRGFISDAGAQRSYLEYGVEQV